MTCSTRPGSSLLAAALVCCAAALDAQAAVYKCQAPDGTIAYRDTPCPSVQGQKRLDAPSASAPGAKESASTSRGAKWSCSALEVIDLAAAETAKRVARAMILAKLKDPYSAQLQLLHARFQCPEGIRDMVCGVVNAKNSYGAYTGGQTYVYTTYADGHSSLWSSEQKIADPLDFTDLTAATECIMAGK